MPEPSLVCMSEFTHLLHEHLDMPALAGSDYSIDDFNDVDETGFIPLCVFPGTGTSWTIARVSEWRIKAIKATGKSQPDLDDIFEWIVSNEPALPDGYAWGLMGELACELCETLELLRMDSDLQFEVVAGQLHLKYMESSSMCHVCEKAGVDIYDYS